MIQLGGSSYIIFTLRLVSRETSKDNKMCLNATYNTVRVGKRLIDVFPIKNGFKIGVAFSLLFFIVALEYGIRRVQVNQDSLKIK